jgi:formylglycine-generating enzyme required for sulfatase activity
MLIKRLAGAAGLLLLLTAAAQEMRAQEAGAQEADASREQVRVGLVIGNDAYAQGRLGGSVTGAKAIAETLRNGGFDVVYAENAERAAMEGAIEAFGQKLEHGAYAIVYFSGYAVQNQGRNFLAPIDARIASEADAARETIDIDTLIDPLVVAKPSAAVIILDASRANPWTAALQGRTHGLAAPEPMQRVAFVYSAEPGKAIKDAPGAGNLFASELAKALATKGLGFDAAFNQARDAIKRGASGDLAPWQSAALPADLVITSEQPRAPDPIELGFWDTIKDSATPADFLAYLESYPEGRFVGNARSRLKQIGAVEPTAPQTAEAPEAPPPPPLPTVVAARTPTPGEPAAPEGPIRDCSQCPELMLVHGGTFDMGSDEMFPFEGPVHRVTIRKNFYIGRREVTFEEWDACLADGVCKHRPNDRGLGRGLRPVSDVDWDDAKLYAEWLSGRTGHAYRLPSESEWEFAARAGSTTTYPWGKTVEKDRANCIGCTSQPINKATPTGTYPANGLGLFDMAGNAAEWVEDCWSESYRGAPSDGAAWGKPQCRERVLRGGSFNNDPRYLRSAARFKYDFDVRYYTNGFRVVRQD